MILLKKKPEVYEKIGCVCTEDVLGLVYAIPKRTREPSPVAKKTEYRIVNITPPPAWQTKKASANKQTATNRKKQLHHS